MICPQHNHSNLKILDILSWSCKLIVLQTVFDFRVSEAWRRKGWMFLFLKLQDYSLLPSKFLKWRSHLLLSKWHLSRHSLTFQLNKVAASPCSFSFSSDVWLCIIFFSVFLSIWCKLSCCQTFGKPFFSSTLLCSVS